MARKPRNAGDALWIKNAKKGKVSKSPYVRYPNSEEVRKIIGMKPKKKK